MPVRTGLAAPCQAHGATKHQYECVFSCSIVSAALHSACVAGHRDRKQFAEVLLCRPKVCTVFKLWWLVYASVSRKGAIPQSCLSHATSINALMYHIKCARQTTNNNDNNNNITLSSSCELGTCKQPSITHMIASAVEASDRPLRTH